MQLPFNFTSPWSYVISALVALGLVAAIALSVTQCKKVDQQNKEIVYNSGVTAEREAAHQEVINHVEEAHNAAVAPTPVELNIVCSKYDRNCPNHK